MGEFSYYLKWLLRKTLGRINKVMCKCVGIAEWKRILTKAYMHRRIDLKNPRKLNEKILWMEYYTDSEIRSRLSDKYEVRKYITEKGYADTLIPIYGLYQSADEIDFETLPERFVLKATHGCDMNYICRNKQEMRISKVKKRIHLWMNTNLAYVSLETHYLPIRPRILCEQYLDPGSGEIIDYKFHCSDGQVRFILVCTERSRKKYLNVFDLNWKPLHVIVGARENPEEPSAPARLHEMIHMANCLAEGIPFVRVDLYMVRGRIFFGEMTFTPATGVLFHFSDEFLLKQGKYCSIE